MSTAQVLSIIDELAEIGTQRITLYDWEPLLREDIGDIILFKNYLVKFENGTNLFWTK